MHKTNTYNDNSNMIHWICLQTWSRRPHVKHEALSLLLSLLLLLLLSLLLLLLLLRLLLLLFLLLLLQLQLLLLYHMLKMRYDANQVQMLCWACFGSLLAFCFTPGADVTCCVAFACFRNASVKHSHYWVTSHLITSHHIALHQC